MINAFFKFGCMHTFLSVASSEMVLSITVDDVTATTAKIDWILISNIPPNRIVDSISIDLTPIEIVGEQSVREGQAENTLASCIVGNTRNKTLTVPGNATSVLLIDLSMFSSLRYDGVHESSVCILLSYFNVLFSKHYSSIYKVWGPNFRD